MSFLQSTSNTAFFIALGIVVLLSGIGFGIVAWVGRLTGALRGREPVPINMLTEGYLLARGKASGRTLRAPLSGRPCVWWEMKVWERRIEIDRQASSDEPDRRASWTLLRHDVSRRPIHCTQGFVTCTVQPDGMTLTVPSEVRDWKGKQYPPENRDPPVQPGSAFSYRQVHDTGFTIVGGKLLGDRYRYVELLIAPNAELFVLGRVERVAARAGTASTHVDAPAHEGGSVAPFEQAQGEENEAEQMSPSMREVQWRIAPEKGRPYIVATQPPEQWMATIQLASQGGLIVGTVTAALAAFMLWARYQGG